MRTQSFKPWKGTMGMWDGMEGASVQDLLDAGWGFLHLTKCKLGLEAFVLNVDREKELVTFGELTEKDGT